MLVIVILVVLSILTPAAFTSEIPRRFLLNNLNKKFTSTPMPPILPLPYRPQKNSFVQARIEDDLLILVFRYLNKADLDLVKGLSTEFRSFSALALAELLKKICPYYVFPLNWLNELLYTFLEEFKLTSSLITEDELEMINFKFIKYGSSSLKRSIISFLNELIYGSGQAMPADLVEWKYNLMRRLSKYSYDLAFLLYHNGDAESDEEWNAVNHYFAGKLFERFTQKELENLVDWNAPFSASVLTVVAPETTCALIELTTSFLRRDEDRIAAIEFMFESNSFSQQFWDYIVQYPHLLVVWIGSCDSSRWKNELEKLQGLL